MELVDSSPRNVAHCRWQSPAFDLWDGMREMQSQSDFLLSISRYHPARSTQYVLPYLFLLYLMTMSVSQTRKNQMVGQWLLNDEPEKKNMEGNGCHLIWSILPVSAGANLEKKCHKTLDMKPGLWITCEPQVQPTQSRLSVCIKAFRSQGNRMDSPHNFL